MQRALASKLASLGDLETISLRHFDCLVFERSEVVKMFQPKTKRVLGGTPQDRIVIGDLLFAFKGHIVPLRPPSKRHDIADYVASVPIANFPELTSLSFIDDGEHDSRFLQGIGKLLQALPAQKTGWIEIFGGDFFARETLDRTVEVVRYLRNKT